MLDMNLKLNKRIAESYNSTAQKARVLTEDWVSRQVYCPSCGNGHLGRHSNNCPVADFFCRHCREDFELKGKMNAIGKKVVDGAYHTMIKRLKENNNPSLYLLTYSFEQCEITNFFVIPKHFFVPQIIEKRKPLAPTARRAGWVGCNIAIDSVPFSGRIFYVRNKKVERRKDILANWKKTLFLRKYKTSELRGWILDVMNCIDSLRKEEFSLSEMYNFKDILQAKHRGNRHIQDKIRQQLQFLRDKNYIEFLGKGRYRLV